MGSGLVPIVVLWLSIAAPPVWASEVSASDLIERGGQWDGEEVTVEGELVGDYGFRSDGWMWTQLNGDPYVFRPIAGGGSPVGGNSGVAVRVPADLAGDLDPPGVYGTTGPVVRATGIWRWHDPGRYGESYLEVRSYRVVQPGRRLSKSPDWSSIAVGAGLILSIPVLWPRQNTR